MDHATAIESMLKNLDKWRHLPKYQLERRADIFFGLFIRDIISCRFGHPTHEIIIPEFPYCNNKDTEDDDIDTNTTVNFDYVILSKDCSLAYIVELKTDTNSFREKQETYLERASKKMDFMDNIKYLIEKVYTATKQKGKYSHLFELLVKLKLLSNNGKTYEPPNEKVLRPEIQVVYIAPRMKKEKLKVISEYAKIISFQEVIGILENLENIGPVEALFADHLRRWDQIPAGARND
ncbi:hypothetical protein [Geomobilimonas luticola]|uniref:DUF4263 domain-containing protein n=1 Tax=Geomobilimonas luticola TaxID=1114878 RepID=A0ABS5SAE4_9BACT|nr:hypothetical protein [Geomobilimonas luticola]MBT0652342.1 hypothetical protein [Geomobilimonas luticola]